MNAAPDAGRARRSVLVLVAFAFAVLAGCVRRDVVVETEPLAENLAAYWTCTVAFVSDGRGEDANESFEFVPWFESRVRQVGVFEPLGRDEGAEAEITLRLSASREDDHVELRLAVTDTKTKASLGELESSAVVVDAKDGGEAGESKRLVALRIAADRIVERLRQSRGQSMNHARRTPPSPVAPVAPEATVAGSAVCTTQCHPPAAAVSSYDEQYRVAAGVNPMMKELRACLDRVGAQLVDPAALLRFAPDGQLRHIRVDVGGYEQLECVQAARARVPRGVWTSRASLLRCEYRCTTS